MLLKVVLILLTNLFIGCSSLRSATFDLHVSVGQFMQNLNGLNQLATSQLEPFELNQKKRFAHLDAFKFDNITEGCSIQLTNLINGLKSKAQWSLKGLFI